MGKLLEKLLEPILNKLDGWKTMIGLAMLVAVEVIRNVKPDLLAAETASAIWYTGLGLAGLGVASKDAKRIAKNGNGARG
jgi:hypothetical protein